ncbi:hypothetical protein RG677_002621 [Vibrio parahaemolyticus]|uniref:hypothetical protein n=1 Tax=Vibrio parahaemolyticus TaxID=670 RepID=UPI000471D476|nr:hypothetical protein [Vibrio parahaemolyticus]EJB8572664.1 hypothetical protein [Vibrio parahaemolyticus]EJE4178986.1 hypothetical protein [Vibrio parahaemolyticus]ELB2951173.1 hypothetical protein [Vibrio parahaemolyticus]MCZ6379638.1 hypothetical protein [Vibrio parahaemolyticus]HCZ9673835.1 hypothetical protein [Vibrio parahaemolyticus]
MSINKSEIAELRMKLKANPIANLEVLASIVKSLRHHDIHISPETLNILTLAIDEEIVNSLHEVELPGGINCK